MLRGSTTPLLANSRTSRICSPELDDGAEEPGQRLVVEADPAGQPGAVARAAVGPADVPVAGKELQPVLLRLAHPVDEGADEAGMQPGVDEASARAQAPGHLAEGGGEVLQVGVEEHPDHHRDGLIAHRKRAQVGTGDRSVPTPGEAELIGRDVEPRGSVAGLRDGLGPQAGAAGQVDAHLAVTGAQRFPQEGQLFRGPRARPEVLVIVLGMPVVPGRPRDHADTLTHGRGRPRAAAVKCAGAGTTGRSA